mmetsp:Transcript_62070/g.134702  ORF Transcript_62070/g.134702 Transcript_62070/m.134702 type:complete len:236 (-) Transcript_62070:495-1202(-)
MSLRLLDHLCTTPLAGSQGRVAVLEKLLRSRLGSLDLGGLGTLCLLPLRQDIPNIGSLVSLEVGHLLLGLPHPVSRLGSLHLGPELRDVAGELSRVPGLLDASCPKSLLLVQIGSLLLQMLVKRFDVLLELAKLQSLRLLLLEPQLAGYLSRLRVADPLLLECSLTLYRVLLELGPGHDKPGLRPFVSLVQLLDGCQLNSPRLLGTKNDLRVGGGPRTTSAVDLHGGHVLGVSGL